MRIQMSLHWLRIDLWSNMFLIYYVFILKTILTDQKWQLCNYHEKAQIEMLNLENPLMLIAQIYII